MPRSPTIPVRRSQPTKKAALQPQSELVALFRQGLALLNQGQLAKARQIYEKVLAKQPTNFDALHLSGLIAAESRNPTLAVELIGKAIEVNPNNPEAHYNRGNSLKELKRVEDAIASYDEAIAIKPDHADAYSQRGVALKALNRVEEAIASYDKAIAIKPDFAVAYSNRGNALKALNRVEEAISSYDMAIAIKPDFAKAYWNKSLAFLGAGEFAQGWELYEWRWKKEDTGKNKRNFLQPLWLGAEDIAGKTILLHAEQGLGDTIQFCRYAKLVKALGARVILEVPKALLGLLSGLEGVDELIEKGKVLPAFDYHCPLLSLPLAFKTDLTNIPSPQPYLAAAPQKCEEWAQRLGVKDKRRVGLAWSGGTIHINDNNRSLTLKQLLPHLPDCCEYVSLQKEVREVDLQVLEASGIRHYEQELKDFTDTAALCELMDLVISVDTSVAHLAGAIGKTTWVLLPYAPDWRWLLDRDDSPWYESVKLYRQDESGTWDTLLRRVGGDLRELLNEDNQMNKLSFNIYQVKINDFYQIYDDLITALASSLIDLGHACTVNQNIYQPNAINILLGSTIFASRFSNLNTQLKGKPYIVFQLEQLSDSHGLLPEWTEYKLLLQNAKAIWDYSPSNVDYLRKSNFENVFYVPPAFHRNIETFRPKTNPAIDVLFIGSPHPRRQRILDELKSKGVVVGIHSSVFGELRNRLISDSKLVLNIHAWDVLNHLETVRLSYLLANRVFVVSERGDHNPYDDGLVYGSYDQLVELCLQSLKDNEIKRGQIAENGYLNIRKLDMVNILNETISAMGSSGIASCISKAGDDKNLKDYYKNARLDIIKFVPSGAQNILDIGCAAGFVGKAIKSRQPCHVTGVEISADAVLHAAKILDLAICGDVFDVLPTLPDEEFDCVLMLDVLGHVVDSFKLLQLAARKLTAQGTLLLVVPNVGHWTIIESLLKGNWNYADQGILDRTHLRFFTASSLAQILNTAGLRVIGRESTKLNLNPPIGFIESLNAISEKKFKDGFDAYQFILTCQKI